MFRTFLESSIRQNKNGVIVGEVHSTHGCILAINESLTVLERLSETKPIAVICEIPSPRNSDLKKEVKSLDSWSDKLEHCTHFDKDHKVVLHAVARMGVQIYGFETSYSNPFMYNETIDDICFALDELDLSHIKDQCLEAELGFEDFLLTAQAAYAKTDARLIRPNEEIENLVQQLGEEVFTIILVGAQHIPSFSKNRNVVEHGVLHRLNQFANFDATFATTDKQHSGHYVSAGAHNEEYGPIHHISQIVHKPSLSSRARSSLGEKTTVRTAANDASFWSKNQKCIAIGVGIGVVGIAATLCVASRKQKS